MKIERKTAIKILILTVDVVLAIPVIYNIMIHEFYKEENRDLFRAMIFGYILAVSLPVVAFLPSFNIGQHFQRDNWIFLDNLYHLLFVLYVV